MSVYLPNQEQHWCRRRPVPLIEIAGLIALFLANISLWPSLHGSGRVLLLTLIGYATLRLFLDRLREEHDGTFTTTERISASIVASSAVVLLLI